MAIELPNVLAAKLGLTAQGKTHAVIVGAPQAPMAALLALIKTNHTNALPGELQPELETLATKVAVRPNLPEWEWDASFVTQKLIPAAAKEKYLSTVSTRALYVSDTQVLTLCTLFRCCRDCGKPLPFIISMDCPQPTTIITP